MRTAVIADTHDRYPRGLPARLRNADAIWHLGDVCAPEVLAEFAALGPPLHIVLGNNDGHPWPAYLDLELHGWRCHLVHIPPRRVPPGARVVLHGHTHVPRDEQDAAGVRWLNPGCISRANRGAPASFGWLEIPGPAELRWRLELL